ncbi:MAG: hypothetical protein ACYC4U_20890 [Pirellulaceae bacterium]
MMSTTFKDRLELTDAESLRDILVYVAGSDCAEGSNPPKGCDCVCCGAGRLLCKLWPAKFKLTPGVVREILDFVDDARMVYRPESVVEELGLPEGAVRGLTKTWGDMRGVIGLELIQWLADEIGVDPEGPRCVGWQRMMRGLKREIRHKVGLPADPRESD